ncbi:MAG: histidinol-phosphate transaminase [Pirellulales bacterium]|nr:histidinol-phosphate transaminase [Pirellulales bacterium]
MSYFRPEIEAMTGYQPGEQPQTQRIIKLNTNENPYPCSPVVVETIRRTAAESLRRYPDPMAEPFRRRAAEVLGIEPDWILCGNGSDDLLTIVTRALVGQGQLLRLPYPSYILYKTLAELQGARSEEVRFAPDWSVPDAFADGAEELRLVFLANPNSPSGTVVSPARVLELAERLPCPLLVDEAYVDFAEMNCLDLVARCERIIVSRSLSKSYALAGLRFGYLVAQPHLVEQFTKVKDSYNCDAVSIAAAAAALGDRAWLAENRAKILATRARLTERLRKLNFNVVDSQANFVWATHDSAAVRPIFERLRHEGIYIRYMNYAGWGDGLRVSVGTDPHIDRFLERLENNLP